jgi:hypothetical protein
MWYNNLRHGSGKWISTAVPNASVSMHGRIESESSMSSLGSVNSRPPVKFNGSDSKLNSSGTVADYEIYYDGEWYADQRCGQGTAKYISGNSFTGFFENDIPVKNIK